MTNPQLDLNKQLLTLEALTIANNKATMVPPFKYDTTPVQLDNEDEFTTPTNTGGEVLYPELPSVDEFDIQQTL